MPESVVTKSSSVQYQVLREKAYQAFYSLTNTQQQITAHVYDVMRSQLPTLELDAVFEAKEDLALAVKNALQATMSEYGYQVTSSCITSHSAAIKSGLTSNVSRHCLQQMSSLHRSYKP